MLPLCSVVRSKGPTEGRVAASAVRRVGCADHACGAGVLRPLILFLELRDDPGHFESNLRFSRKYQRFFIGPFFAFLVGHRWPTWATLFRTVDALGFPTV